MANTVQGTLSMKNEESKHQCAYFEVLQLNAVKYPELTWIYASANGGIRNIKTAVRLKKEGVKSGVWDVHIPLVRDAPGAFIEFKIKPNKLTANQTIFRDFMVKQGFQLAVCYDWESAVRFTEEYLGINLMAR